MTATKHDLQVQSIAHAVLRLEQSNSDYGAARRRLLVVKYRGQAFRDGYHDYKINRGGLQVFPRLVASEHAARMALERIPSGIGALDTLLGGGLEKGTSTLFVARRVPANRRWRCSSQFPRPSAASTPRCSSSTKA